MGPGRDECVVGPGRLFAAGGSQCCRDCLVGQRRWILDAAEQDDRRGIERAQVHHNCGSIRASISARDAAGSIAGRWRRRSMSSAGPALRRGSGRNSATGRPCLVTMNVSPSSTRLRTSPLPFRSSRTLTLATGQVCITGETARQGSGADPAQAAGVGGSTRDPRAIGDADRPTRVGRRESVGRRVRRRT